VEFFCCQAWKAIFKVETHLVSEYADGAGSCAVILSAAFGENAV
jgi:hypothetical protein